MAKFNQQASIKTTNKSGHVAYSMPAKTKLVTQVLTSFFNEKKFYGDNTVDMERTICEVAQKDPAFVANLAIFARREFNMRSVSHVLTAYLANVPEGKPFVRETVKGVCIRGDDATEIMAFYLSKFGKPVPNSLKRGINDMLQGWDEYTLAKYAGNGNAVKMRDLLCICHPKPANDQQAAMWKACLEKRLAVPETWETQLSANGNNRGTWERLIDGGKVGYMALLRNLRNIVNAQPRNISKVLREIADPEAVKRSKQLPFRFLSAYKELSLVGAGSRVLDALETATEAAIENMPRLPGTTVIAVDISGSMQSPISAKSIVRCCEVGMMLGLMANRICENAIFYEFNTSLYRRPISTKTGILYACTNEAHANGGTAMWLPFDGMLQQNIDADRIIIISDNECNRSGSVFWGMRNRTVQSYADEYRKKTGNNIWVHAIDLMGYGTQQFCGARTNIIAGWSDKVLNFIALAEQGESTLEKTIETYHFNRIGSEDIQTVEVGQ